MQDRERVGLNGVCEHEYQDSRDVRDRAACENAQNAINGAEAGRRVGVGDGESAATDSGDGYGGGRLCEGALVKEMAEGDVLSVDQGLDQMGDAARKAGDVRMADQS